MDHPDKPELSSAELLRQAREAFALPELDTTVNTEVDGPSIQDLLETPLSSESLLPQRSVDYWAEVATPSTPPMPEPPQDWESGEPLGVPRVADALAPPPPSQYQSGPPLAQPSGNAAPGVPPPPWLEPVRDELGLPPAPTRPGTGPASPQPLGPPARPVGAPAQPGRGEKMPWRLIVVAIIGIGMLISLLTSAGTTSVSQVDVGDCFENPGTSDFTRVSSQDCAGAHEIQIFAQVQVDRDNQFTAGDECGAELVGVLAADFANDAIVLPEDTQISQISDVQVTGAGTVYCTIESPSGGLVGSLLPE